MRWLLSTATILAGALIGYGAWLAAAHFIPPMPVDMPDWVRWLLSLAGYGAALWFVLFGAYAGFFIRAWQRASTPDPWIQERQRRIRAGSRPIEPAKRFKL